MKRILTLLIVLAALQAACAEEVTYNTSEASDYNETNGINESEIALNGSNGIIPDFGINFSEINTSELSEKALNATRTGVEPIDGTVQFLIDASPFLLLIIGIVVFLFAGFAKIIAIIIIIMAVIRLL
jgi:hypothetical protein